MDGRATEAEMKAAIEAIAARSYDKDLAIAKRRNDPDPPSAFLQQFNTEARSQPTVTLRSAESVRVMIRERADAIIWTLGELHLVTLLITSLALVNTIVSSVRARQWDMGIMRATGLTRFGLFRLIIAESLLVGLAACLLSLGLGVLSGYCGTGVTRYVNVRGGQITPLVIPWVKMSFGFGLTLALCLLAALWPAYRTGRAEPLRLLQAGRSAS